MHGANGWYGWRNRPWDVGAFEVWYWSQKAEDRERVNPATPTGGGYGSSPGAGAWMSFLSGQDPTYPERTIERDREGMQQRLAAMRRDTTPPERRLRSEEHTSELQSLRHLVCRLLLEKKKKKQSYKTISNTSPQVTTYNRYNKSTPY